MRNYGKSLYKYSRLLVRDTNNNHSSGIYTGATITSFEAVKVIFQQPVAPVHYSSGPVSVTCS